MELCTLVNDQALLLAITNYYRRAEVMGSIERVVDGSNARRHRYLVPHGCLQQATELGLILMTL